jgi:hypothetical protein
VRTFPYTAAGSLIFNDNLQNDGDAHYWMYFTTVPSGNYGDSDAILVEDADGNSISGTVDGNSSISFTFAYDSNEQGGRTKEEDADVTVVAIGLDTAQFVKATSTLTRSTANNVSLVAALERNYSNPT